MRIGVIDLDTSHPQAFLPLLRHRGHDVVAVFGGHTVVDDEYTRRYAQQHGIGSVVSDPKELLGAVDAVFIHSVDWDNHVVRALPFAESGVPIHICKPFAGRASDIRELVRWADSGVRLSGGSALRWSASVAEWRETGQQVLTAYAATYGHPLDYGIHCSRGLPSGLDLWPAGRQVVPVRLAPQGQRHLAVRRRPGAVGAREAAAHPPWPARPVPLGSAEPYPPRVRPLHAGR
jgi:hypothetical protein